VEYLACGDATQLVKDGRVLNVCKILKEEIVPMSKLKRNNQSLKTLESDCTAWRTGERIYIWFVVQRVFLKLYSV